jgi:dUTP pyrophosphatase
MTKLTIGTKVLITDDNNYRVGEYGTIIGYPKYWDYDIRLSSGTTEYYDSHQLISAPKQRGFIALQDDITVPTRATKGSAGYDLYIPMDIELNPGESKTYDTLLSSYMLDDEVLCIHIRSSVGIRGNVVLSNGISIIDSDYRGHIKIALRNEGSVVFTNSKERAVAQGIFTKYLVADGDSVDTERDGGIGSTSPASVTKCKTKEAHNDKRM